MYSVIPRSWQSLRLLCLLAITGLLVLSKAAVGQTVPVTPTVFELSDVSPEDWSFQAVQRLVEDYGCLQGNSERLFSGEQQLTRYEFATALKACLDQLLNREDLTVGTEDWETLQRLQTEFAVELQRLQQSLDTLDARVDQLDAQSFSPTTTLKGEVIFALVEAFGDRQVGRRNRPIAQNLSFGYRVRLNFDTSFTGEDRLRIRLQGRDVPELEAVTGTTMVNLGFDGSDGSRLEVSDVAYEFPVGSQLMILISPIGAGLNDYTPTVNPLFSSSGGGAISNLGRENPIAREGGGTGFGFAYAVADNLNLAAGYVANGASQPTQGLWGDRYGAIVQLTYEPIEAVTLGVMYVHSSNSVNTGTGSALANDPFSGQSNWVTANAWGLETALALSPTITLGGRVGVLQATAEDLANTPTATLWTWAILLGVTDVGSDGSLVGLVIGQPPKVTHNDLGNQFMDSSTSLHLEAFYRWQVTEVLSITPGIMMITNPDHNANNPALVVGVIRATLEF